MRGCGHRVNTWITRPWAGVSDSANLLKGQYPDPDRGSDFGGNPPTSGIVLRTKYCASTSYGSSDAILFSTELGYFLDEPFAALIFAQRALIVAAIFAFCAELIVLRCVTGFATAWAGFEGD